MKISEIIDYLTKLKEAEGDIETSVDFSQFDDTLYYDDDLECVFGH